MIKRWLLGILLSPAERRGIRTLWELGCTCGVITLADGRRWDEAQKSVGNLLTLMPNG